MSSAVSHIKRALASLAPIFRPPFDGLIVVTVLYYGWCFLVYPHSQILRGNLPDTDDYMYLTQVTDWLKGQGWFDNVQHRLNPPDGVPIHFSRLTQLPMAGLITMFHMFGIPLRGSAMLTALIYPLFLFAGLLASLRWLAQSFMPKNWSGVTSYVALFATGMTFLFMLGHLDHHGLILIIITLTLGCTMRMMMQPAEPRWGIAAGLLLALGLTVALEILPWLLIISGWLGLWAMAKGGIAARNILGFGLALLLGSAFCLLLTRPPSQILVPDVLTYSVVYIYLTAGIAAGFTAIAALAKTDDWLRWMGGSGVAAVCGLYFLHSFPDLIAGPYGGMDPELAQMMLNEIDEARPLIRLHSVFALLLRLGGVLVALAAAIQFVRAAKPAERWRWGLMLTMLIASLALTLFYQQRFMGTLGLMTVIPLAVLLQRGWLRLSQQPDSRRKFWAELGLLLLVGPLPALILPALYDGRSFNTGMMLFPVTGNATHSPCDTYQLEGILRDPRFFGDRPRLIISSMGQGPELLFRTQHRVLSAPYHMDVSGNIDTTRFFSTPYASEAEAIARRRGVDLVVVCRFVPTVYIRPPSAAQASPKDPTRDLLPHFIELLMSNRTPAWLKLVRFPTLSNFLIFEVVPPKSIAPAKLEP